MALVGEGPNAPVAVQRAVEFAATEEGATLTLLNIQTPDSDTDTSPQERGEEVIEQVTSDLGMEGISYDTDVVVDNVEAAALNAVEAYDTVCIGATREGAISQALFGSLPEALGTQATGTVVMAEGASASPRSIREALIERLPR